MTNLVLPESTHRLFDRALNVVFITVDPDGSPQASLMWVSRDGDELVFGVESSRRKVRNLRRDPRVTLVIEDEEDSPVGLRQHLVVRGTVRFEGPGIAQEFAALMDRQARRYYGTDYPHANRDSDTTLIGRITPTRIGGIGPWAG
ncbi:PPOX class probable F420-dependent enzyme [Actinoalloteichus hoggarensis]|nr:TIGR03618 family F420-dependent PPOX class oxidoreductase [Actinoalloteichus hoggarensis]MBB5922318.1 PPOX class probable F420-dependent enzyme [Actinoalloteichus hoggarensis]